LVVYWQATDKALENSRLFGTTPCRSLWLASTGGHCSKKNFGNSKKNKKNGIPLIFSVKMMSARWILEKLGDGSEKNRKK